MRVSYIQKNKQRGIKYDWKKVMKLYKSLKCPDGFFDPTNCPIETAKYLLVYSARGGGKTINVQLLGMCLNALYGSTMVYIRDGYDQIAEKSVRDMFSVILAYGYISKITGGRWNSCTLKARRWYYCNVDEDGQIIEKASQHFMFMCSIDEAFNLKSGFNDPQADFIVYDEFIPTERRRIIYDGFVKFADLLSTLIRQRWSPIIWLLANNTDKESPFFYEFEIADYVKEMKKGDKKEFKTEKGTPCYIEWFNPDITELQKKNRKTLNELFFGFKNPRLGSITNEDWQVTPRQHIPKAEKPEDVVPLLRNLYIYYNGKYVRLDVVKHVDLGICCYAHWATRTYADSVILTTEDRFDSRYLYGFGQGKVHKLLTKLFGENRVYYATNDIGTFIDNYMLEVKAR